MEKESDKVAVPAMKKSTRVIMGLVLAMWIAGPSVWGDISRSLYVGNLQPVLDQSGHKMVGSGEAGANRNCARVEIRVATDGIIRPPSLTGAAHPKNPLLSADSVGGMGMNAAQPNSGLFCMVFPSRPAAGTKIFARVYNAPTLAEATFYADSKLATVPGLGTSLVLAFGAAQPLDFADADGDGLINSWEKALGIDDRLTDDYDGDGMRDYHEMLAGTAPDDFHSLLAFRDIRTGLATVPAGAAAPWTSPLLVRWQSVPGKKYRLEFVPALPGEQAYLPLGDIVTAGDGEYEIEYRVDVPADAGTGAFRLSLVVE